MGVSKIKVVAKSQSNFLSGDPTESFKKLLAIREARALTTLEALTLDKLRKTSAVKIFLQRLRIKTFQSWQ